MAQLSFASWLTKVEALKAPTFYLVGFQFVALVLLNLSFKLQFWGEFLTLIGASIACGVGADLAAHTYWSGWKSDLTMNEFLHTKLFTRTHDIDFEIVLFVFLAILFVKYYGWFIQAGDVTVLGIVLGVSALSILIVIADLIKNHFYH